MLDTHKETLGTTSGHEHRAFEHSSRVKECFVSDDTPARPGVCRRRALHIHARFSWECTVLESAVMLGVFELVSRSRSCTTEQKKRFTICCFVCRDTECMSRPVRFGAPVWKNEKENLFLTKIAAIDCPRCALCHWMDFCCSQFRSHGHGGSFEGHRCLARDTTFVGTIFRPNRVDWHQAQQKKKMLYMYMCSSLGMCVCVSVCFNSGVDFILTAIKSLPRARKRK